jgi:hypothetical protein
VTARNGLIERYPASFKGTELDPEENRLRREKLCHRVEALAVAEEEEGPLTGETLARRLKEALAANTMGARRDGGGRADADRAVVESARAAWKRLGPVPGEAGASLEARFEAACARFFKGQRNPGRVAAIR